MKIKELIRKARRERTVRRIVETMHCYDIHHQDILDYCIAELQKRKPEIYGKPRVPEVNPGNAD